MMYNKEANKDCNCLLVQVYLKVHCVHMYCSCFNFLGGIDIVLSTVSTGIPRQVI